MRKSRYTEEQIIGILKEAEAGMPTADLVRKHGVSAQTFYRWKARQACECRDRNAETELGGTARRDGFAGTGVAF